ncbi:hydantoinase B/oxoprolinase family protein [Bacillus licheniformis]|uniref:hydantoinase B/oxoprolinase family protein n=1 Tax=Bacillus licheniformis TaxID=1402 RepID=UPI00255C19F8|nr:hydantoinase B/oxoprolinase family protein [Bacillus licheniformis]WIX00551.1 hydantoinase B/oxoprolinase family protein [Bacillus licheniformis]
MINQDFILSQVVGGSLDAVAREMSATVTRTARSPLFNEAHDFTTGVFDLSGKKSRLVAQAPGCTLHLYAVVGAVDHLLDAFRYDLHPGDILLVNDPYHGGSQALTGRSSCLFFIIASRSCFLLYEAIWPIMAVRLPEGTIRAQKTFGMTGCGFRR